jgi:molybdopterin-guanine dinucleotide biosynthesis protein A
MGTDKRHMSISCLRSRSLMDHAASMLRSLCTQGLVLVPPGEEAGLPTGFTPVADRQPGQGPLLAISDALESLSTSFALVMPVDMPCLRVEQIRELMSAFATAGEGVSARFLLDDGSRPTFPLVLRRQFAAPLAAEVDDGQVRLFQGLRAAGAVAVSPRWQQPGSCGPDPFLNLNRPADIEVLEEGLRASRK